MKKNTKLISFILSISVTSFMMACNSNIMNTVNPIDKSVHSTNSANKIKPKDYIFDLGTKNSIGATIRISLSGFVNNNFSIKASSAPVPKTKMSDTVYYKVGLTNNPDDPENNLLTGTMFTVNDLSDSTITFLNVPDGGPYHAYIQIYDLGNNNITENNRKILLGGSKGYVSTNKVIVNNNQLSFKKADNTNDTINYLDVYLTPRAAIPAVNNFSAASSSFASDTLRNSAISVNENGDGLVIFTKESSPNYIVYARKVENFIPIGNEIDISQGSTYSMNIDTKPAISLDSNGNGYIVWSNNNSITPDYRVRARKIIAYVPETLSGNPVFIDISNTNNSSEKFNADIKVNPVNGNQAIFVWTDKFGNLSGDIYERSINGSLSPTSLKVNTDTITPVQHDNARISILNNSGDGVVVWEDNRDPSYSYIYKDVYMKKISGFSTNSTPAEEMVNQANDASIVSANQGMPDQYLPQVNIDSNGNGIVVWLDKRTNSSFDSIYARRITNYSLISNNEYILSLGTGFKDSLCLSTKDFSLGQFVIGYQNNNGIYSLGLRDYKSTANPNFTVFSDNKISDTTAVLSNSSFLSMAINSKGNGIFLWNDQRDGNPSVYGAHVSNMTNINDDTGQININSIDELNPYGAIAYYPFSYTSGDNSYYSSFIDGIKDRSGNGKDGRGGHPGEVLPSIAPTVDRLGYQNDALVFNSSSPNYISIKNPGPASYFTLRKQFTFNIWAVGSDPNWSNITSNMSIISNFEDGGFALKINDTGVGSVGAGNIGIVTKIVGNPIPMSASIPILNLGSGLHMFTGTYDGRYLKFYIDRVLEATVDASLISPIDYTYPNNDLIIGGEAGTSSTPEPGKFFDGTIDDVRIYDFALNQNEIKGLYKQEGYFNLPP